MINLLILIGIIGIAIIVLLPYFIIGNNTKISQPGISNVILSPGYRCYTISVPNEYNEKKRTSLILVLHYAGHGVPFYGEMILRSLIIPAFEEIDPIIVAPDCPAKDWLQPTSEQLIFDLLDAIQNKFNIDPKRILITGYSLGGIGTWYYAGHFPEQFSAAIVMAGIPPEDVLKINWKVPLMVLHGRDDEVYPLMDTSEIVSQLEKQKLDINFRILEGVGHYDTSYYVAALRNTIPWLLDIWENDDNS